MLHKGFLPPLIIGLILSTQVAGQSNETLAYVSPLPDQSIDPMDIPATIEIPEPRIQESQIDLLHTEMLRLEKLNQQVIWPVLSKGPLLKIGDSHSQIPQIREILMHLGDLKSIKSEKNSQTFDQDLYEALIRFQKRHGGKVDGLLGPSTRRQLNRSPQDRADLILLNIYRMEQFTPQSDKYVRVNVPDYRLHLIDEGRETLSMKTIVGKRKRKTPIFSTDINRVVVNPSWHVPRSIAYKDILPIYKNDPEYLDKKNLKVVTGWGSNKKILTAEEIDLEKMYRGENYQRLWEPPSESNTLGKVKFLTTGPHAVYLHDTSARRLFSESKRAFSSGCIRVEQPKKLADALLEMSNQLPVAKVDRLFSSSKTVQVNLQKPIKLYVTYWTSWVDEQGILQFRDDLYKHDRYELSQLKQASSQEILISKN